MDPLWVDEFFCLSDLLVRGPTLVLFVLLDEAVRLDPSVSDLEVVDLFAVVIDNNIEFLFLELLLFLYLLEAHVLHEVDEALFIREAVRNQAFLVAALQRQS